MRSSRFPIYKCLFFIFFIIACIAIFFSFRVRGNQLFPIATIKIASEYHYVSKALLKKLISKRIQKENFLTLDISQLKKELLNIPWIHQVAIRRSWPDTLLIRVEEHKPIVRFNTKGILNHQGEIFHLPPPEIPKHLPHIHAPREEYKTVFEHYQKFNSLMQHLESYALKIIFLEMKLDGNIKIILNNHITLLLGKSDLLFRFKRFISTYPKLRQEALMMNKHIKQIDLRYTNGFAVQW